MATKKPKVKSAAKKQAPAKAKSVKKVAPAKKTAKPVKKIVKPVKKAVAPKKVAKPVKKIVKPVKKAVAPKKVAKPVKKIVKPVKKVVLAKKIVPAVKKIEAKKPMVEIKKAEVKKPVVAKIVEAPKKAIAAKHPKDIKITPAKPVVLPKINTKTSRQYQPDFMKSVLDSKKNDPGAPSLRYADAELQEFKELIQRKLETARKELNYLQGLITRKDETGGDESENRYMTMEDGSLSMEREQLSQMASRQITFIDHLEKALMRIENKTYGICRVTGRLIDKARLRAVPHATLSIEAKMGIVK